MIRKLCIPNVYMESINDINIKELKNKNIKLICLDLDNTIIDSNTRKATNEIEEKLKKLKNNFEIIILSNNKSYELIKHWSNKHGIEGVHDALKPLQFKYKKTLTISKYSKKEILFIGDKIITDIYGGNLFGGYTMLVNPICNKNGRWYVIIMKYIDKIFLKIAKIERGKYYDNM